MAMIELRHLTKTYGTGENAVKALDDVSLEIEQGEIFGIIGLSGAGKSTLVRCINLLETPTAGEVIVDGKTMTDLKGKALREARRNIGMIFQGFDLLMQRTAQQNVRFPLELAHTPKAEADKRARELLKTVGLEGREGAYPAQLSGGMKQRVAIARAYAAEPQVLLMDEPFGALDAQTRTQLQSELLQTWEHDMKTCFFITHDVDEAIILAQKVIVMSARPGRVKAVIDIDIPYPRDQETKMSPRFLELKNEIWSLVYQEYLEVRK